MLKSHSLSQLLQNTWDVFEKQTHFSRSKPSIINIHQLRILAQKLEAILTLTDGLHSTHNSKNVASLIKHVRKSLGPLRDIQVEGVSLENLKDQGTAFHKKSEFNHFFLKQQKRAKKLAIQCLDGIFLETERKGVHRLVEKLQEIESKHDKDHIRLQLDRKMKSLDLKFHKMMREVDPEEVEEIHRFRILAKKLRYQGECLNLIKGHPRYDLKNLKAVQSVTGRIQNDSVMLKTLNIFLSKKKHQDDPVALKLRSRIEENQNMVISEEFKKMTKLKWKK